MIHVAAAFYQVQAGRWEMSDSPEYIKVAENLQEHQAWYSAGMEGNVRMHHYTKRPPLYPILLWFHQGLFGSYVWICLLQIGLSMLSLWMAWSIWGILRPDRPHKWLVFPFLLFYPAQWMYSQLIMTEILFQCLIVGMGYLLFLIQKGRSGNLIWIYTSLLILSMLTKPVMYLFCIPHLILLAVWASKWKRLPFLIPAIIPLIFVLLFCSWNQQRTGYFHFSSIQNLSLLQYTTHNLLTQVHGADSALVLSDAIHYTVLDAPSYAEGQTYLQEACTKHITDNLFAYSIFHAKGMLNFFLDPGRFDLYHFSGLMSPGDAPGFLAAFSEGGYQGMWNYLQRQPLFFLTLLLFIALFNGLKLLALGLLAWNRKISWIQKILLAGFILYVATLTGTSGASRFAFPVYPLLLICTALAIEQVLAWIKQRSAS